MRAIVFGQSGLGKESYLRDEVLPIAKKHGHQFEVISLGKEMQKLDSWGRDPTSYPGLPVTERELLRRQALRKILDTVQANPHQKKDYVLIGHAVFETDTGLIPATDIDLFQSFTPDIVVVLIDDFHYIDRRLRKAQHYQYLSLANILEWRDAEITTAKAVAQQILPNGKSSSETDWRFFVLARAHHPKVLYRLLYERRNLQRIYSSFAITGATPVQEQRITDFKARLSKDHIVFDPYKLSERSIITLGVSLLEGASERLRGVGDIEQRYAQLVRSLRRRMSGSGVLKNASLRKKFETEEALPGLIDVTFSPTEREKKLREDRVSPDLFAPYRFRLDELISLQGAIDGQILGRDYLLIDQSNVVCALVPRSTSFKKPEVSAGSQSELTYAKFVGRDRLVVYEGKRNELSPWITEHSTKLFNSIKELESELRKRSVKKRAK